MKKLVGEEIIRTYLDFFAKKGHMFISSASLVPKDDLNGLWVNAGVVPFSKYFDGTVSIDNRRLTSCQKCIRVDDINQIGISSRHHTFFQMLGNFSIGDYFKEEALTWAYELLTSDEYFGISSDKLYVTVYPDDEETHDLWIRLGIEESHIIRLLNNYWEMGEGPCGPDTEIFYDRGEKFDSNGLGIKLLQDEIENDRYIELWNIVFSQYYASKDMIRDEYTELPNKCIDTGMGVERMACVLQQTDTDYETDLFLPIIKSIEEIAMMPYDGKREFKIIADHIRCITFAIGDGVIFENYGRGYLLKLLLKRTVMAGRNLKINRLFMADLVDAVMDIYASIYPNFLSNKEKIKEMISCEENLFLKTVIGGEDFLRDIVKNNHIVSGENAFKLYEEYGFPIELTVEYAMKYDATVDVDAFKKYLYAKKIMNRNNSDNTINLHSDILMNYYGESTFIGYEKLGNETEVVAIIKDNNFVDSIEDEGYIILRENPFYAESGGQIYDTGFIKNDESKLEVLDVFKAPNGQHLLHVKVLSGILKNNSVVLTHVLQDRREAITKHHSAVHLLQKVLQDFLGKNIHQAGSRVDENRFRFDFNYHGRLSNEMICQIEKRVQDKIDSGIDTIVEYLPLDVAKKKGAMALFEEKYDSIVRVITIGDSVKLCSGTHVKNTKDIGNFAIISVENKGMDTFRIEGTVGDNISAVLKETVEPYHIEISKLLKKAKNILISAKKDNIDLDFSYSFNDNALRGYLDVIFYKEKLEELREKINQLEKIYQNERNNRVTSDLIAFTTNIEVINGIKVNCSILENYDISMMKKLAESICAKYDECLVVLANVSGAHVNIVAKSNTDKVNCGVIVKKLAIQCKGNGGGSKNYAQGGGSDSKQIASYLENIKEELKS